MVLNAARYGLATAVGASLVLPIPVLAAAEHAGSMRLALWIGAAVVPVALVVLGQSLLWPAVTRSRAFFTVFVADIVCWFVGMPALLYFGFAACAHKHTGSAWAIALAVYLGLATYLLASPRRAWLWPLAILAGLAVGLVVLTSTPAAYCET